MCQRLGDKEPRAIPITPQEIWWRPCSCRCWAGTAAHTAEAGHENLTHRLLGKQNHLTASHTRKTGFCSAPASSCYVLQMQGFMCIHVDPRPHDCNLAARKAGGVNSPFTLWEDGNPNRGSLPNTGSWVVMKHDKCHSRGHCQSLVNNRFLCFRTVYFYFLLLRMVFN